MLALVLDLISYSISCALSSSPRLLVSYLSHTPTHQFERERASPFISNKPFLLYFLRVHNRFVWVCDNWTMHKVYRTKWRMRIIIIRTAYTLHGISLYWYSVVRRVCFVCSRCHAYLTYINATKVYLAEQFKLDNFFVVAWLDRKNASNDSQTRKRDYTDTRVERKKIAREWERVHIARLNQQNNQFVNGFAWKSQAAQWNSETILY